MVGRLSLEICCSRLSFRRAWSRSTGFPVKRNRPGLLRIARLARSRTAALTAPSRKASTGICGTAVLPDLAIRQHRRAATLTATASTCTCANQGPGVGSSGSSSRASGPRKVFVVAPGVLPAFAGAPAFAVPLARSPERHGVSRRGGNIHESINPAPLQQ